MRERLECKCCGEYGHEPHCPIRTGHNYCDDCGRTRCACRASYRPLHIPYDEWRRTAS